MKSLIVSLLLSAPADSVLTSSQFAKQVATNHPSILAARISVNTSRSAYLSAKSFTEPNFSLNHDRKKFQGTNYWNLLGGDFKLPTLYGVNFYGAFEQNSGTYLNAENSTPIVGLYAGGIEVPIGRDLWMNKGRLEIIKSRIGIERAELILQQSINETLFDAMSAYWNWAASYHILEINKKAQEISYKQLQLIKSLANIGERPIIDTLESHIQWQNRKILSQEAEAEYISTTQELRSYLWEDSLYAKFQTVGLYPSLMKEESLGELSSGFGQDSLMRFIKEHPIMKDLTLQNEQIDRDLQFGKNQLLPKLSFKYNLLSAANEPFIAAQTLGTDYYKASVKFAIPIFLRKERAQLQIARQKQSQISLKLQSTERKLDVQLQASYSNYRIGLINTEQMRSMVLNYYTLMKAEEIKFQNGESSVFLINQRENMYFQSQAKLITMEIKWRQSLLKYYLYRGDIDQYLLN